MSIRTRLRPPPAPTCLPDRLTRDGWWLVDPRHRNGRDPAPHAIGRALASPALTSGRDAAPAVPEIAS